jgi:predicted PhzF superfamily epimerase YddE/YHI9
MKLPIFQVDAFTGNLFGGNPAAVVILPQWPPDETLQAIAAENNLAETAFVVPLQGTFELRWFTPEIEVDLCGHATLASACVLFNHGYASPPDIVFRYQEGTLNVARHGELLAMRFPSRPPHRTTCDAAIVQALGAAPREVYRARDLLAVFDSQQEVESLRLDFQTMALLDTFAVIASAPGKDCDFVSRFFAPKAGIPEDPATGSSHCTLVPYWSERLGKKTLHALQLSRRRGEFFCEDRGEWVQIAGRAVEYLQGHIFL